MHRLHHTLEYGVEDLSRFFRIAVGQELHGALEVGEEHRDLLALAFKSGPRRKNLPSEVLGGIGLRRRERLGLTRNGLPALKAELRAGGQLGLTLGTDRRQTSSALQTELGLDRVFVLAPRTLHENCPAQHRRLSTTP